MITIETRALRATLVSAPKSDIRHYLNGVYVEIRKENVLCASMDGHRLTVALSDYPEDDRVTCSLIIPYDAVKKAITGYKDQWIELDIERSILGSQIFTPIDEQFPDIRRVIPAEVSGELAIFNPHYVVDAYKSIALFQGKTARYVDAKLIHNGTSAGVVRGYDDHCFVVVMPIRDMADYNDIDRSWIGDDPK